MFFYLEGPDGAGKTTLAEKLAGDTGVVLHCGPFDGKTGDELFHIYDEHIEYGLRNGPCANIVLDRGPLSELVYGQICRGRSRIGAGQVMQMIFRIRNGGGIPVYVDASDNTLDTRIAGRAEYTDRHSAIRRRYRELIDEAAWWKVNTTVWH